MCPLRLRQSQLGKPAGIGHLKPTHEDHRCPTTTQKNGTLSASITLSLCRKISTAQPRATSTLVQCDESLSPQQQHGLRSVLIESARVLCQGATSPSALRWVIVWPTNTECGRTWTNNALNDSCEFVAPESAHSRTALSNQVRSSYCSSDKALSAHWHASDVALRQYRPGCEWLKCAKHSQNLPTEP